MIYKFNKGEQYNLQFLSADQSISYNFMVLDKFIDVNGEEMALLKFIVADMTVDFDDNMTEGETFESTLSITHLNSKSDEDIDFKRILTKIYICYFPDELFEV